MTARDVCGAVLAPEERGGASRRFGVHHPVGVSHVVEGMLGSSAFSALAFLGAVAKPLVS